MTLGGGRGLTKCHTYFFCFLKHCFQCFWKEFFSLAKQDKASKDTFLQLLLIFQRNLSLKISHQKLKNVTQGGGGVRKKQKKCHVLFEWPLREKMEIPKIIQVYEKTLQLRNETRGNRFPNSFLKAKNNNKMRKETRGFLNSFQEARSVH